MVGRRCRLYDATNRVDAHPKKELDVIAMSLTTRCKAVSLFLAALLASCGGGGGGGTDEVSVTSGGADNGAAQPLSCASAVAAAQALAMINATRASERQCGSTFYAAAPPLRWNDALLVAATAHSADMASNNFFSHVGSSGSSPATRVAAAGYRGSAGENIAANFDPMDAVFKVWLDSPGHCANIMNPQYQDYAVACVGSTTARYRTYWTQAFGTPAR